MVFPNPSAARCCKLMLIRGGGYQKRNTSQAKPLVTGSRAYRSKQNFDRLCIDGCLRSKKATGRPCGPVNAYIEDGHSSERRWPPVKLWVKVLDTAHSRGSQRITLKSSHTEKKMSIGSWHHLSIYLYSSQYTPDEVLTDWGHRAVGRAVWIAALRLRWYKKNLTSQWWMHSPHWLHHHCMHAWAWSMKWGWAQPATPAAAAACCWTAGWSTPSLNGIARNYNIIISLERKENNNNNK